MKVPAVSQTLNLVVNRKTYPVTCTDIFDGGYGYYFDAVFSKRMRHRFAAGEQCTLPEFGAKYIADFVSYPTKETWKVRFLIPKWM